MRGRSTSSMTIWLLVDGHAMHQGGGCFIPQDPLCLSSIDSVGSCQYSSTCSCGDTSNQRVYHLWLGLRPSKGYGKHVDTKLSDDRFRPTRVQPTNPVPHLSGTRGHTRCAGALIAPITAPIHPLCNGAVLLYTTACLHLMFLASNLELFPAEENHMDMPRMTHCLKSRRQMPLKWFCIVRQWT